jgi:hypothetical protein
MEAWATTTRWRTSGVLGMAVFRDGAVDGTVLGYVHPHGSWIDWRV